MNGGRNGTEWGTLHPDDPCATLPSPCPANRASMPSALRPGSSTGTLHHVILLGLERRSLFRDDQDRVEFVARLAARAAARWQQVLAECR